MKDEKKVNLDRAGCLLMAFWSALSLCKLMSLRGGIAFSQSTLTVALWAGISAYYLWARKRIQQRNSELSRRLWCYAGIFSLFFGALFVAGYQLQWVGYTAPGFKGKFQLLLYGIGVATLLLPMVLSLFAWQDRKKSNQAEVVQKSGWKSGKVFVFSWLGIWLCWIPVWLAYYPVIMSYDFHKQSLEALWGPQFFNNHHPLAHTWLIYVFRSLGESLGSFETGFALFSLFQQMIVSSVLGYACVMIYRLTARKWAVVLTALFFGYFPVVSVFVMCTTKDVLFGAFFVLFILLFIERSFFAGKQQNLWDGLWVISGILMILFRNNALYAMVVFGLFLIVLSPKKMRIRTVVLAVLLLVGGKGALMGLQYGFGAYEGSSIEKYSVIYQSMARVGKMQSANLSEADYALLDAYVTAECWQKYNPPIADTIKGSVQRVNFNEKKSWNNMGEVLKAWATIGLRYPNEYIDAFLDLTRGYWFLDDTSHAEMLGVGLEERMGLLYTYNSAAEESLPGMQHISKFPWLEAQLEKVLSANAYYDWPVLSVLFKPALWCWLVVLYVLLCLYGRERAKLLVGLYPLMYLGTMLLGPTAIIRYVFQFILIAPVLLALIFSSKREKSISIM